MNISQFIDKAASLDLSSKNLLQITGIRPYPLLFFSLFIKRLKSISTIPVEVVHLEIDGIEKAKAKLETTFLGQKFLYWLHDITIIKGKNKAKVIDYIKKYDGPNLLAFFSDDSVTLSKEKNKITVHLEESIDAKLFLKFVTFLGITPSKSLLGFTKKLFDRYHRIDFDTASILISYALLLGRGYNDFLNKWLDKIIAPEKSLFALSQYFFQKNSCLFFTLWSSMHLDYSEPFWVVFWSEQLWRASNYVYQMKNRNLSEAKRVSFRLPFSFMQRNWKDFHPSELKNAHDFIYDIDYALKNGGSSFALDLFYSKFFNGQFQ